jgi:hypothetical protein
MESKRAVEPDGHGRSNDPSHRIPNDGELKIVSKLHDEAELVDGFTPTRCELAVLAEHYYDEMLYILFDCWVSGDAEWRFTAFANRRLTTIEDLLGKEDFDNAIASVKRKWDEKVAQAKENLRKKGLLCERCEEPLDHPGGGCRCDFYESIGLL